MNRIAFTLVLLVCAAELSAADVKEKAPGRKTTGTVYEWKSKGGVAYRYRIPKKYNADKGANLVVILHGSNLDRRWGFANHSSKDFRPGDIVLCPDGTTSNGRGGLNFLNAKNDVKLVHELLEEWKAAFKINATFLYGHSQGSFFAFLFAGEYPGDVQGVVGHASGTWTNTQQTKKGHALAIVLMHGTQDPVVPYVQSVGGFDVYTAAKFPMVRLRSLEGWNHWPAEHNGPIPHTSQQIAWCEGMTTADPARMEACFDFLASCKSKERTDYAAVYSLAMHIGAEDAAPAALKKRAAAAMKTIEALAQSHAAALAKADLSKFKAEKWLGHAPMFLRAFAGVPARAAYAKQWEKLQKKQIKDGNKQYGKYWTAMQKNESADAFAAGVAVVKSAYLWQRATENVFLNNLATWQKDAKKLRISKKAMKDYAAYVKPLAKAIKGGAGDFDRLNRKCGKL